jgi:radical SAM superfamily enzyme YgiQ (UPF0313 family)
MFMHITWSIDKAEFIQRLKEFSPKIIGFSATTPMFKYVKVWAQWAREIKDALIICGGIHARMDPDRTISVPGIDAVCYGEGELSLVELCFKLEDQQDVTATEDFLFKKGEEIIKNPLKLIEDLDQLPDPDRDIFDHPMLYDYSKKDSPSVATFVFSRGCPFDCSFCSNTRLVRDYGKSKPVRFVSPSRAVGQIVKHLTRYSNTDYVRIDDTNISINHKWFKEFCRLYKLEVKKPYMCQVRIHPALFNEEIVTMLKDSGCFLLIFGVEHGSEEYRKRVLNREMTDDEIISAFKLCHKHRLATRAFIMFGTPYETVDLMLDTIKLAAKSEVFDLSPTMFYPFPGTELHAVCRKEGFKIADTFSPSWPVALLDQPKVSKDSVYLVWRASRILLLAYALSSNLPNRSAGTGGVEVLDKLIRSSLHKMEGHVSKAIIDDLATYDSLAHRIYKKIFHPGICAQGDLLLRV